MTTGAAKPKSEIDAALLAHAEALLVGSHETLVLIDAGGVPHAVGQGKALTEQLGIPVDELIADPKRVIREIDWPRVEATVRGVLARPGSSETTSLWARKADGELMLLEVVIANLQTALGATVMRIRPSDEQIEEPESTDVDEGNLLEEQALTEDLFRAALQRRINRKNERIWSAPNYARSVIRDRRYDYAVVLISLDRFNVVRGGFGVQGVAKVSEDALNRIVALLRGRDMITDLGGANLAVLLDGVGDVDGATRTTEHFVESLSEQFEIGAQSLVLSPIIGIATSERRYDKAEDILRDVFSAASRALRSRGGPKHAAFETRIRVEDKQRLALMAALHDAIKKDEIYNAYQPVVSLGDGSLVGFEALARWKSSTLGQVSPAEFIPIAEETGLIIELGRQVLMTACQHAAVWNATVARKKPIEMSVNVSGAQLYDLAFQKHLDAALATTGLNNDQLCLELTESLLLDDMETATERTLEITRRGVHLALDDFGTGYSSLSYLHQLPYKKLKIDRSFLADATIKLKKVVKAIVQMSRSLGLIVVAEGIESERQRAELRRMGCQQAQGYYFAAPMGYREATALVQSEKKW